jgi:hypothetical protein
MEHSTPSLDLQARISALQAQALEERLALKDEITELVTTINPIKLITHGFKEIITSPEVKEGLFDLTIGMSAGYIAKKIVIGKSENALQHIAGNVVGMFVSKNVAEHSDKIRMVGLSMIRGIFSTNTTKSTEE